MACRVPGDSTSCLCRVAALPAALRQPPVILMVAWRWWRGFSVKLEWAFSWSSTAVSRGGGMRDRLGMGARNYSRALKGDGWGSSVVNRNEALPEVKRCDSSAANEVPSTARHQKASEARPDAASRLLAASAARRQLGAQAASNCSPAIAW